MFGEGFRLQASGFSLIGLLLCGCFEPREGVARPANECARCHGDESRGGTALEQAAPPFDLAGNRGSEYPGVGAHAQHLASSTHATVACSECHLVPAETASAGHADSALPAEIVFGALASQESKPRYDGARRDCTTSYCHRSADPVWTAPRAEPCGSCHALPPPEPHAASGECFRCHGEVIDEGGAFLAPDKHVDGTVQVEESCSACHGAPPDQGAHVAHRDGGAASRPLACGECHLVPATPAALGHLDPPPAELVFAGVALSDGREPSWNGQRCSASWCHGPTSVDTSSPAWTSQEGPLACTSCHGAPPAAPHPQIASCATCHAPVAGESGIVERALHVDGLVQVSVPSACDACHGQPPDLGAHATHAAGTAIARAVACSECHLVPATTLASGHVDTPLPAELTFSSVAISFGTMPSFDGEACADSYCHGGSGPLGGGALTTPSWNAPAQSFCGSCHSLPPPAPHPSNAACSQCHGDIAADLTFPDPSRHVDGVVDF